jgi:hypothetical protein
VNDDRDRHRQDARTEFDALLGLLLGGVSRQCDLGLEDLAGLGEHPLHARGQAAVGLAAREVTDDLGDLDDIPEAIFSTFALYGGTIGGLLRVLARRTSNTRSRPPCPTRPGRPRFHVLRRDLDRQIPCATRSRR